MTEPALLVANGRVRTLDPGDPSHEAVLIRSGRIVGVGPTAELRERVSGQVSLLDAEGGTILPAFTDSHTHFKRASVYMALFIDFDAVAPDCVDDVVGAVRERALVTGSGSWLQGDSLDPARLTERRFPTRWELDSATQEHPVVLRGVGRHVVAANSLALRLAGIDESTSDPPGGHIDRDDRGVPTGVLHEEAKLRLDADRSDTVIPAPSEEERLEALDAGTHLLASLGIAVIHEIPRTPEQIGDWLRLRERRDPTVRVRFYVRGVASQTKLEHLLGLGIRSGFGDEWIRFSGMKVSIDGSVSHRNAMVYEPYPGTTSRGLERVSFEELGEALRAAHDGGLQVAVHAIGQRAVDNALRAFGELAATGRDVRALRHRIEHAFLPPGAGQLEQMRDLGIVLSTQPAFIYASGDRWVAVFEDEQLEGVMPIHSAMEAGVSVVLNSDFPNSPLDPFVGIQAAVTRRTREGRVLDPSEAIGVEDALRLMTRAAAHATFEEGERGRLVPGYHADLIVVDRDPVESDPDALEETLVTHTVVGGRVVFSRAGH